PAVTESSRPSAPMRFSSFCNAPAPTEIYTLSLHDALPISDSQFVGFQPFSFLTPMPLALRLFPGSPAFGGRTPFRQRPENLKTRSEEHTSELQSRENLVCRLLLEKKKKKKRTNTIQIMSSN